jgi:hypothetical protein
LTTAAVALEERRPVAAQELETAPDATVATLHPQLAAAPAGNSRLIVTTIVLVQTSWLSLLGYAAFKLFT